MIDLPPLPWEVFVAPLVIAVVFILRAELESRRILRQHETFDRINFNRDALKRARDPLTWGHTKHVRDCEHEGEYTDWGAYFVCDDCGARLPKDEAL